MLPYFTRVKRCVIKSTCENFSSFRYFFNEKTVKLNAFSIFVFILMAGVFVSKTRTNQAEIYQGKKFYHRYLYTM